MAVTESVAPAVEHDDPLVVRLAGLFQLDEPWLGAAVDALSPTDRAVLRTMMDDPDAVRRAHELAGA